MFIRTLRIRCFAPLFGLLWLSSGCGLAQNAALHQGEEANPKRPKIGLALEGGGALGLAHVGLLEWLEQNHVPIDYIAGSSMGGLVGGFYSTGMSAAEMHKLVDNLEWGNYLGYSNDDRSLSYRRKQDYRAYGNSLYIGLRHGLGIPSGFDSGQELDLLLGRVALPYGQMKSFDDLPTPFRCVATDIVSGTSKVFRSGSLPQALRATMSIPALFAPVADGKHEFVDGGLLNNLPVDVVKAMGADIVIAVYLSTDNFDPNKPQTAFTVLSRSLSVMIAANEQHNMEAADILVTLNLAGFTTSDFERTSDLVRRGFEGAQKKSGVLSKFRVDDKTWNAYAASRQARRRTNIPPPQFIDIAGIKGELAENVRSYFTDELGKPINPDELSAIIKRIHGVGQFSYLGYNVIERNGQTGLTIYVGVPDSRPPTLQPAIIVDGSDYRNTRFQFGARLTQMNFGGFRSELRTDIAFGSTYGIATEYFHPFHPLSNWFIAPRAFARTEPLDFYQRNRLLSLYRMRSYGGGLDFGYSVGNTGEIRIGYEASRINTNLRLGDNSFFPQLDGRYGATKLSYTYDQVDDEIVPHLGFYTQATVRYVDANPGSTQHFPTIEGTAEYFLPLTNRSSLFFTGTVASTFGVNNTGLPLYFLGGPGRLSAYGTNELFGNGYLLGRAGYLRQIALLSTLTGSRLYVVANYEVGKMYGFNGASRLPMDGNAGLLFKTLVGPLFIGGAVGDDDHRKLYFQLGRMF